MSGSTTAGRAVFAFLALVALQVHAQAPPERAPRLLLENAVESALSTYPIVQRAEAGHAAARAGVRSSRAAYFPSLRLSGTLARYQKPMVVTPLHGFSPGQLPQFDRTLIQGAASLSLLVFDGFARNARLRQSRAEADAAGAHADEVRQAVIAQTARAYLEVQSARQTEDAHRSRFAALEAEKRRIDLVFGTGRAAQVDVLRIEAALAAARAEAVTLVERRRLAERDLARLTGLAADSMAVYVLPPLRLLSPPVETRADLLAQAREHSPKLRQAESGVQAAEAARAAARGARWPQLRAAANYLDFDSPGAESEREWNAGVELTVPVFTGGALGAAVARAAAGCRVAREDARLVRLQVEQALDVAQARLDEARAREQSLALAADRYEEVARIEALRLESGTGTETDYLDSQADLLWARAGLVEARRQVIAARIEIAQATGTLDSSWLTQNLEQIP
jgi:outer membrane protein TolC